MGLIDTSWKKKLVASLAALALVLAAAAVTAAPALAQAADQYGPGDGVAETDLLAQLTVECPENAPRVVGYRLVTTGVESKTSVALTDEDGDGVLTGTQTFPRFPPGGPPEPITVDDVRIVAPDGSTVEQFGPVTLDRDEIVLEASVSLCDGGGPDPGGPDPDGDQYDPDGDQYDPGDGSDRPGTPGGGIVQLPETGGVPLTLGAAGALLIGGGLLLRRIHR